MSDINLYNLLKRIPDATDDEVQKAISDVANSTDVATKADIKDMATKADLRTGLAELKTELLEKIADSKHTMIMSVIGVGIVILVAVLLN